MARSNDKLRQLSKEFTRRVYVPKSMSSRKELLERLAGEVIKINDSKEGVAIGTPESSNNTCCYRFVNGNPKLYDYHNLVSVYRRPHNT